MAVSVTFFPVENGDMTLVELESGRTVLIDCNIRQAADDEDNEAPDVAAMLRGRLKTDTVGRVYVDAFLLSHPDQDHCRGLERHFHLGPPEEHTGNKILIREMWSSPMVYRRADATHTLSDDAKAWNREAKRRVRHFLDGNVLTAGNRILVLGEDENGKTDDLGEILVKVDGEFRRIDGAKDRSFSARLLAPLPLSGDAEEEERLSKNNSSVILRLALAAQGDAHACLYLTGGDAEVVIWERLWERHCHRTDWLQYDLLLTPHHCSWHSLSYDSWSDYGEDAELCQAARNALSQTRPGAYLVASCKPIKDDKDDPPCIRAKREYVLIANEADGAFKRVEGPNPTTFSISRNGPRPQTAVAAIGASVGPGAIGRQPLPHG